MSFRQPAWVDDVVEELAVEARIADRYGDLDEARLRADEHLATVADLDAHILAESFLLKSAVLRHREDHASLLEAADAAGHAMRLATARPRTAAPLLYERAVLEHAACLLVTERNTTAREVALGLVNHDDPGVAARACWLVGQSWLNGGEPAQAVGALQNAAAEVRRGNREGERPDMLVRLTLAAALDEAGRFDAAHELLQEDRPWWTERRELRRARIGHYITAAINGRRRGDLAGAIDDLDRAETEFAQCTGMAHFAATAARVRAECLDDRGQEREALVYALQARSILQDIAADRRQATSRPRIGTPAVQRSLDRSVRAAATTSLGGAHKNRLRLAQSAVARLEGATADLETPRMLSAARAATTLAEELGASQAVQLWHRVEMILNDAEACGVNGEAEVDRLVVIVESLQGVIGAEVQEAEAQCRAGIILAGVEGEHHCLWAERLLWRGVVRADSLPGADLLQASAEVALARLLAAGGQQRDNDALDLAVRGLRRLDRERFAMRRRDHRRSWLEANINPATELAIELALRCGQPDLARDLVVFSRVAGVTMPAPADPSGSWRGSDVPLVPMPTLRYIDGTSSTLGSGGVCWFL